MHLGYVKCRRNSVSGLSVIVIGVLSLLSIIAIIQHSNAVTFISPKFLPIGRTESCDDKKDTMPWNVRKRFYVVLSSDGNPTYLFPLPIAVLCYNRLGVAVIIFLVGSEEDYHSHPQRHVVIDFLQHLGAQLFYVNSKLTSSHMLAQTVRLFASGIPGFPAPDNADVMLGDADMLVFSLVDRLPQPGQRVFVFNSKCCGYLKLKGESSKYPHYPMQNTIMSTSTWREIMNITKDSTKDGDTVVRYLIGVFGKDFVQKDSGLHGSPNWSIDQQLLSLKIHHWLISSKDHASKFGEYSKEPRRIDRADWDKYTFNNLSIADYHDAHILHPVHTAKNWTRTVPLLRLLFDNQIMEYIDEYHERFLSNTPAE